MADSRIPLFDLKVSPETKRQVREVLTSGWLNSGPKVKALETSVAELASVRYATALSSATAGLQLTLETLGAGPGTEVVTTPFTFAATAATILRTGAELVFADIDPVTLNIDPDEVQRHLSDKTVAVVSVDIAGHPADYPRLTEICKQRTLPLIADAAHSLGAQIGQKSIAQLTDGAVHSFQATKNLTTADGGMLLTRHKALAETVRLLLQHAMTATAFERQQSRRWEYDVVGLGQKANMTDVHAAIGLGQLAVFEKNQARRVRIVERYQRRLADLHQFIELPQVPKNYTHAWHLYIVKLQLEQLSIDRDQFIMLLDEAGIEAGVHYKPLFEMSFYKQLGYQAQHFPNTVFAARRVVTLPLYPTLKTASVDYICDQIRKIVDRNSL